MCNKFYLSDKFIVRRPLLTYNNRMLTMEDLHRLVHLDFFQEAIYYASPDLYDELMKYIDGKLSEKETNRMTETLYKYLQRIHYRCTPFGMFAYCSIGQYSNCTEIRESDCVQKHYRYDFKFLNDYVYYLLKNADLDFIKALKLCTNQSLISVKSDFYLTAQRQDGISVDIKLPKKEFLTFIISKCNKNISVDKLIEEILEVFEVSYSEVGTFIKKLILEGILISDIKIGTTGEDNFAYLYKRLKSINPVLLKDLHNALEVMNSDVCFEIKQKEIDLIVEKAQSIGLNVKRNMQIQVDSFSKEHVKIDKSLKKHIYEWFEILSCVNMPHANPLKDFIGRYCVKYEDMSMPILEVLNNKVGIGYHRNTGQTTELMKQLFRQQNNQKIKSKTYTYNLNEIEQIVLNKLSERGFVKDRTIYLTKSDFPIDNTFTDNDYPLSYSCMYKIVGYNDDGPVISDVSFSGPSGSCLITRFADSLEEINDILDEISDKEQAIATNVILAEISHLSSPHSGNVQIRPSFRKYEIPLLSFNMNETISSVELQDLYIKIKNQRVSVVSSKNSKEVIPCFSSAFNYKRNTTDVYQFLGDIQQQKSARGLSCSVETLLRILKHLPRICYKNIIISPECWLIENTWKDKKYAFALNEFKKLHRTLMLPRFLTFHQGDNYVIIDIETEISILVFFKLTKNYDNIILTEFLSLSDDFNHLSSIIEVVQPFLPTKK